MYCEEENCLCFLWHAVRGTSKLSKHSGLYTLIITHTLLLDLFACIETYLSIKITGVGCDY